jgi:nitronate monooxygenase
MGARGNARIGCGFITWSLAKHPGLLDAALARKPAAVVLSFGDPRPFAPAIHAAGSRLICQVQTVAQGREASDAGADVIIAQGTEAGGHAQVRYAVYNGTLGAGFGDRFERITNADSAFAKAA